MIRGPKCFSMLLSIIVLIPIPTLLFEVSPRYVCLAFRSPIMYVGVLYVAIVCMVGMVVLAEGKW